MDRLDNAGILSATRIIPEPQDLKVAVPRYLGFCAGTVGPSATRLTARVRAEFTPSLKMAVMGPWLIGVHQVMQRAQLRNLKRRIEAAHSASTSTASGR